MRFLIFFFCVSIIHLYPNHQNPLQPTWLVGNWERMNNKPLHKNYETWYLNSNNELIGSGYTLKGKDTVFKEELAVISKNDTLFYQVTGVNENPTLFRFTKQTDSSFVCENHRNEFPNKIFYFKSNNKLNAIVSNDEFKIEFVFKRKNN